MDETSCKIFFFIEGDMRNTAMPYNALISAILNAELRKNTHVIRTMDENETGCFIRHLSQKCEGSLPTGIETKITKKRKRDANPDIVFTRQLMCIPSISENVAKKLFEKFASIPKLQAALKNKKTFPKIELDAKHNLGKARIELLCKYSI